MQDVQKFMGQRQPSQSWPEKALLQKAAVQASSVHWHDTQKTELLEGVVKSGTLAGDWHWHYANVTANADNRLTFNVDAGITLGLILGGQLNVAIDGKPYYVDGRDQQRLLSFYHPVRQSLTRTFTAGEPIHKFTLTLAGAWLARAGIDPDQLTLREGLFISAASDELAAVVFELINSSDNDHLHTRLQHMQLVLKIIDIVHRTVEDQRQPRYTSVQALASVNARDKKLLQQIDCLVASRQLMLDDLRLKDLAQWLNVSESKIQRLSKRVYGVPLVQYIRGQKLASAHQALVAKGLSVGECAFIAGYKHPSNFTIAYKKAFGFAPGEFKDEL